MVYSAYSAGKGSRHSVGHGDTLGKGGDIGSHPRFPGTRERVAPAAPPSTPLALSASGRERMVYGRAAASEDKRMDLAGEIARFGEMLNFGDILNMDGPLVGIGPRLVCDNSVVGGWKYSQRG